MARSIVVPLPLPTRAALGQLAERELRDPRLQARLLVEEGLRRAGLLSPADRPADPAELPSERGGR